MSNNKQIEKPLELPHQETIVGTNTIQTKPFDNQKTMSNNKQQTAVKQFVATFKTSIQIGPDDWKVINPSMLCNQNTTLGEIEHFVNSNNNVGILEFKVIELTYEGGNK
jgi:hypothetical protein